MADNVQVTQGTGTAMATEQIASVHYPKVKVTFGEPGDVTDVSDTSPLPVAGEVTVDGSVDVTGTVAVSNFPATQPVSGNVGVTGTVAVSNFPSSQPVSGTVAVSNFPSTQPVSGTVTANAGTGTMLVDGSAHTQPVSISGTLPVSGTVAVSNFPATQPVSIAGTVPVSIAGTVDVSGSVDADVTGTVAVSNFPSTQPVSGTVAVSNFPVTQPVSGTVTANAGTGTMLVDGSGVTQPVSGTVSISGTTPVSGTVAVSNFPATQPVSGTVAVSNFPATQPVSGSVTVSGTVTANAGTGTMLVDGSAHTQPVSGTVAISGTTPVSGTVAVSNFPATQPVSGTVTANAGTGTFTVGGTVTANIGTSGSLALDASVTGLQVNQASTTSGQKGNLIQGAVTTAAPTYTTAQTSPLSLTTTGALRTDSSGSTQPVSGTVTANIGTSGSLALDTSVAGLSLAQSATTSGQKGVLIQGAVTTAAPTYTTAQTSPLSLTTTGAVRVDGSAVTQPISAASLPLPALAATSTLQTSGGQKSQVVDGANATVGPVTALSGVNYLPVIQASSSTPGSTVPARATMVSGSDGTNARTLSTDTSGNLNVNTSLSLSGGSNTFGAITVGTSALIANVSGGSNLTNRRLLTVYNNSSVSVYWGWANTVTTSNGTIIAPGQLASWAFAPGSSTNVYLIASTSSNNVRVTEGL